MLLRNPLYANHFQQRQHASYLPISTSHLPILAVEPRYLVDPFAVSLDYVDHGEGHTYRTYA